MLTDKAAKAVREDQRLADGAVVGLYLVGSPKKGTGKWVLRYVSPVTRTRRDMGLGQYPLVTIAEAREAAFEARRQISKGFDPLLQRAEAVRRVVITFEAAANDYIDLARHEWKAGSKNEGQWRSSLEDYAFPSIGKVPVDRLTAFDFEKVLSPIWLQKAETASRVLQRCDAIMRRCLSLDLIAANPVDKVPSLLPKRRTISKVGHPMVPWRDLKPLVSGLLRDGTAGTCREAIEFVILSAARSNEVRSMKWSEIDLKKKLWTLPGDRTKNGNEHRIPLSDRMIEILRMAKGRHPELVFPSQKGKVFSDNTLSKFLRDHGISSDIPDRSATVHGFRSSFRTWGAENGISAPVMESALNHTERNKVVSAYTRTDYLDERRKVMKDWAALLT